MKPSARFLKKGGGRFFIGVTSSGDIRGQEVSDKTLLDTSNIISQIDSLAPIDIERDGLLLGASIILFGKRFLPDFHQCQLRLAKFNGTDKTAFFDQKQIHGNAFTLLDEAMLFLQRHLPIAGKIIPGILEREDELNRYFRLRH